MPIAPIQTAAGPESVWLLTTGYRLVWGAMPTWERIAEQNCK